MAKYTYLPTCNINLEVSKEYAFQEEKFVRGNQMPLMTKQLSKETVKRSRLRNKFLRNRTEDK